MRIEKISCQPDRAGRYYITFENAQTLRLYRQTVEDFALYAGKELDETQLSQLREAAGQMSAKMRAVRIISASSVSKKDLRQRLIQKGEDPQQADQAVSWLSEMDLLDDGKTAEQIVHRCIGKGYGLARAKQALYEKRIPKQYWEEALDGYPDQMDWILSYLRSHIIDGNDSKQVKKAVDALIRRGHSYAHIRQGLESLAVDEDFLEEV